MATIQDVPEPWASAMLDAGFEHGGKPSYRALARRAGIGSAETVRQMILGMRLPDVDTLDAVADALGHDRVKVAEWVGDSREVRRPYQAPSEASLLTREEQNAINDLIRAIAKTRRTERAVVHSTGSGKTEAAVRQLAGRRGSKEPTTPSTQAARTVRRRPKGNPAVDEADKNAERGDPPTSTPGE